MGKIPTERANTGFASYLPDRVWYLTVSGHEMWCRRPYAFFFTTSEAASEFAVAMSTGFPLSPIGVAARDLVNAAGLAAMRDLEISRIFIDPRVDPVSGDVYGEILRVDPPPS